MQVNEVVVNGVTELSLVNDTVSEETLLDDTTAHDASGNLIVGKAKYINPNLIINPDFSINQRGQTEYSGFGYTVDGWFNRAYYVDTTILAKGIRITYYNTEMAINWIYQIVESLKAGTYTLSMKIRKSRPDLSVRCYEGYTKASTDWQIIKSPINMSSDGSLTFTLATTDSGLASGDWIEIEWAKLELGSVATPFVPPDPATELVKCQRYFRTISRGAHVEYAGTNGTDVVIRVPFEVPMRVTPSCFVMDPKASLHYCNGWVEASTELTILNANITQYGIAFLHVSGFNLSGLNLQIGQSLTLDTDNAFGISAEL